MSKVTKAHTAIIKYGNRFTPVELAIPAGLAVNNQTALGHDPIYNFIADLSWLPADFEYLRHDLTYVGYNVPADQLQTFEEYHGILFLEQKGIRSTVTLRHFIEKQGYIKSLKSYKKIDISLTEEDINQIVSLLGKYCRSDTLRAIRSTLSGGLHLVQSHSIFERMALRGGVWHIIGAQCYIETMKEIRKSLIN